MPAMRPVELTVTTDPVPDAAARLAEFVAILSDIDRRVKAEANPTHSTPALVVRTGRRRTARQVRGPLARKRVA
jgi:hypothetical protein